jgi:hypothetical protein
MRFFVRFLASYGYSSVEEFLLSLFPSFRYNTQSIAFSLSFVAAIFDQLFGIGPLLAFAMVLAVLVETWTGIHASKKKGIPFESFRFSRCVLKVAVWYSLLFITHAFEADYSDKPGFFAGTAHFFFSFVFTVILSYFLVEYVTSILENVGVITGKGKESLINAIRDAWTNMISKLNHRKNENA